MWQEHSLLEAHRKTLPSNSTCKDQSSKSDPSSRVLEGIVQIGVNPLLHNTSSLRKLVDESESHLSTGLTFEEFYVMMALDEEEMEKQLGEKVTGGSTEVRHIGEDTLA